MNKPQDSLEMNYIRDMGVAIAFVVTQSRPYL